MLSFRKFKDDYIKKVSFDGNIRIPWMEKLQGDCDIKARAIVNQKIQDVEEELALFAPAARAPTEPAHSQADAAPSSSLATTETLDEACYGSDLFLQSPSADAGTLQRYISCMTLGAFEANRSSREHQRGFACEELIVGCISLVMQMHHICENNLSETEAKLIVTCALRKLRPKYSCNQR